jgi:hypothetical protein
MTQPLGMAEKEHPSRPHRTRGVFAMPLLTVPRLSAPWHARPRLATAGLARPGLTGDILWLPDVAVQRGDIP